MSYTYKQQHVDKSKWNLKCTYSMTPQYITIHNTYNDASAQNEAKYHNNNNNQVSYHIVIDDKEAIETVPLNRNAWHCGDANGNGNRKSIGIEIAYSKSGGERYVKAEENAVQLTAKMLYERGWGMDRVRKHQDWSGKFCPHRILEEKRWDSVVKRIENALNKLKNPQKPVEPTKPEGVLDNMKLTDTSREAMREALKRAAEKGIVNISHKDKVSSYDDETLFNYYITAQARTLAK